MVIVPSLKLTKSVQEARCHCLLKHCAFGFEISVKSKYA